MRCVPDLPDPNAPSHLLLETVLESMDACVAVTDPRGIIVCANQMWQEYPGDNPLLAGCGAGTDYLAVCERVIKGTAGDLSIVGLGIRSVLTGKVPRLSLDYPHRSEAGTAWFAMLGGRAADAGLGAVIRHRDITERMTMEQRLRRSESLFHLTTENARDLITILGTTGKVRYRSPSYRKTLGYSEKELNLIPVFELVHPDDRALFQDSLRHAARQGLTGLFEVRLRHGDGSYGLFESQASAVDNGGGDEELILLFSRDITERKAVEAERARMEIQLRHAQKMEAVGQLAAGIAHEINTPTQFVGDNLRFLQGAFQSVLGVARAGVELGGSAAGVPELASAAAGLAQRAREEELDYLAEEAPSAIQQSLDGLARVSTIVQAMKVFTHPSAEGLMAVDINQAIANTLIVCRNEWKYVCEVEQDFDEDLADVVCSPGEFNQVILNIIVNAAHAIAERQEAEPEHPGRIRIETLDAGDCAEIRVTDNGRGIPEHQLQQIWLPFFTTKPVGKGTGQGLSIVHSIISRHHGSVAATSEVGAGSCFTIRLPFEPGRGQAGP